MKTVTPTAAALLVIKSSLHCTVFILHILCTYRITTSVLIIIESLHSIARSQTPTKTVENEKYHFSFLAVSAHLLLCINNCIDACASQLANAGDFPCIVGSGYFRSGTVILMRPLNCRRENSQSTRKIHTLHKFCFLWASHQNGALSFQPFAARPRRGSHRFLNLLRKSTGWSHWREVA